MLLLSRLRRGERGKEEKHLLGDTPKPLPGGLRPPGPPKVNAHGAAPLTTPLLKRLQRNRDGFWDDGTFVLRHAGTRKEPAHNIATGRCRQT